MHPAAHTMPIYLLGSLQYFADVRAANASASPSVPVEATTTPGVDVVIPAQLHPSGVGGGEGDIER